MILSPEVTNKRVVKFFKNLGERFREIHGNKYSYDKAVYVNSSTKLTITCPIHGDFQMSANKHLAGQNCTKCSNRVGDTEEFIRRANIRHNNYYTYNSAEYKGSKELVTITCTVHGDFIKKAYTHLYGDGCNKCVKEGLIEPVGTRRKYTLNQHDRVNSTERFIEASIKVHGNTYTYNKSVFTDSNTKVVITCPIHGNFKQLPRNHFHLGQGCSSCRGKGYDNTKSNSWFYIYYLKAGVVGYGITTQPYIRCLTHNENLAISQFKNAKLLTLYKGTAKEIEDLEKVVKKTFSSEKNIPVEGFKRENTKSSNLRLLKQTVIMYGCTPDYKLKQKLQSYTFK